METVEVPASLIVPLFRAVALVPIDTTSVASSSPDDHICVNTSSFVPVPEAYGRTILTLVLAPALSFVTVSCGVPPVVTTSTASLKRTRTERGAAVAAAIAVVMN